MIITKITIYKILLNKFLWQKANLKDIKSNNFKKIYVRLNLKVYFIKEKYTLLSYEKRYVDTLNDIIRKSKML